MLGYDPELEANYKLYQELLSAISNRDFNELERQSTTLISSYMKTSLKTLRKHLPYIANSFIYPYNNGRMEGTTRIRYLIELRMVIGISRTLREDLCFISSSNPLKQHAKQTKKKHTPMQHKDI